MGSRHIAMTELGELLQQARTFKGVSLREVERATRINRDYLAALEAQDFAQLPPAAYARGIVRNYAQYLGLDAKTILDLFDAATGGPPRKHDYEVTPATKPLQVHSHWAPNFAIIAFMVFISAIIFAWMYSAYFKNSDALATRTVGVATVTPVDQSLLGIAPTPRPTVVAQGGGAATTTPSANASPAAAVSPEATAPAATTQPDATQPPDDGNAAAPTPTTESAAAPAEAPAIGDGPHAFVVSVTSDVWVDVNLDGSAVFSDVLPAGGERVFYGNSVAVSSGNSSYVRVFVDGDDMGTLGSTWDATFTWP